MEIIMKKVVIIGGGIAGLSAGIYAAQAGFSAELYEKHSIVGGQCTGWRRGDYFIDNCIHWLTGTKKSNSLYDIWENVGVLGEGKKLLVGESFYSVELDGDKITLWKDLEKTEREMLALSPKDETEIKKFITYTRLAESLEMPISKPFDMMNPFDFMKLGMSMTDMVKVMKEYGKMNMEEWEERFSHPLLKRVIRDYMTKEYLAYALIVSYATFTSGNGGIPEGGSLEMAMNMKKRLLELGGKVFTGKEVDRVQIEKGGVASGIILKSGEVVTCDYVICASDTDHTFHQLLDEKYMDKKLKAIYDNRKDNPVSSAFQVAFAVDGTISEVKDTLFFPCEPIQIATQTATRMSVKNYRTYGEHIAPSGKTVIQSNFIQYESDYKYWMNLYEDKEKYNQIKMEIAREVLIRIETRFPGYKGKIHILDVWTPVTYNRYCNSYYGAYMSFIQTKGSKTTNFSGNIKGLRNVILASQWLMAPGGLPTAAVMGKFAVDRIVKKEKRR
jgi:phytoene dehydrogenase-like protein